MNFSSHKQEVFLPSRRNDGGLLGKEIMLRREMGIPLSEGGGTRRNMRRVFESHSSWSND